MGRQDFALLALLGGQDDSQGEGGWTEGQFIQVWRGKGRL